MSLDQRLNRLMPTLTARERATLILRSLRENTSEDPLLRRTMPNDQAREFNHYIDLMNACNMYLPLYITMVEGHSKELELRFGWLLTLARFGNHTWNLAQLVPASKRAQAERSVAGAYPAVEFPWQPEVDEHSWAVVSERAHEAIRRDLMGLWQELKGIDAVLEDVASRFDGEDPLRSVMPCAREGASTAPPAPRNP